MDSKYVEILPIESRFAKLIDIRFGIKEADT